MTFYVRIRLLRNIILPGALISPPSLDSKEMKLLLSIMDNTTRSALLLLLRNILRLLNVD
jgi:hypothetical protein